MLLLLADPTIAAVPVRDCGEELLDLLGVPELLVDLRKQGRQRQNTVIAVGKSVLDRTSTLDIGALMLTHGGGEHRNAGTCQVAHDEADAVLDELATVLASPELVAG